MASEGSFPLIPLLLAAVAARAERLAAADLVLTHARVWTGEAAQPAARS
jgi:hypothetical protein